jgi:hypothetical protein
MDTCPKLPILSAVPIDSANIERWVIEDEHERRWTGDGFAVDKIGSLYAHRNVAIGDIHKILKSHFADVPPVRYVVPLVVEVYNHEPIEVVKLARYLSQASSLNLRISELGNGPGDSLVLPTIEWSGIKPLERNDDV